MKKHLIYLAFLKLFLLTCSMIQAQNQKAIDSLLQVSQMDISNEERVDVYIEIALKYQNSDSAKTALFGNKALNLANEIGYVEGTINPLYPMGVATMQKGNYEEAMAIFTQMADLAAQKDYAKGKARAFYGLGWLAGYLGNYDEALQNLLRSTEISEELDDKNTLVSAYNIIGIIHDKKGNTNKALEYYFRALEICEELDRKDLMASCYTNIGIIYKNQGNFEKALDFYMKAFQINEELGLKDQMAKSLSNIGMIYYNQKNYEKTLEFHLRSLKIKEELRDRRGIAYSYTNIGLANMELKNYSKALDDFESSIQVCEEIGVQIDKAQPLIGIGETYRKQDQFLKARNFLTKGIDLAQKAGSLIILRNGVKQLALVEKELGNFREAYEAQVLFKQMADSLNNEETVKRITRLEAEYEFQKERDSIQLVQQQEMKLLEEKAKRIESRKQAVYIILGLLLLAGILGYVAVNRSMQRKQFQSLRNRISRDLHDEIGSTLSSIALFGIVASKSIKEDPDKADQLLMRINSNATQTIESMNDIVWAINAENDSMLHLISRMRNYASELEDTGAWDIQIDYDSKIAEKNLDMIQRRNIYLIFKEAINNAVKYSGGTSIDIKISSVKNTVSVEINDNGSGFEPEKAKENNHSFGGNGLKNMKRRAEELGGELSIQSSQAKGTSVVLNFNPKQNPKIH